MSDLFADLAIALNPNAKPTTTETQDEFIRIEKEATRLTRVEAQEQTDNNQEINNG